jgi:hypothetical protein
MRPTTIAAFIATVVVAVPAGWRWLDADIEKDGKRLRPLQESFTADGVTVRLDVDRSIVMTGDSVTAKLVAVGEAGKRIAVDVYAMSSRNYEGERVERPWVAIDKETVQLVAAPNGGTPVTTKIKLGERPKRRALIDSFQIFAQAHGAALPKDGFDGAEDETYHAREEAHAAAAIRVTGWSGNNLGIKIEPRGKITPNEPFTIAVRVKNTTNKTLRQRPRADLTTEATLKATYDTDGEDLDDRRTYLKIERDDTESNDGDGDAKGSDELAPGAEQVTLFTVTPHNVSAAQFKKVTFLASAFENWGLGAIDHGAYEAKTFDFAQPTANAVAKK